MVNNIIFFFCVFFFHASSAGTCEESQDESKILQNVKKVSDDMYVGYLGELTPEARKGGNRKTKPPRPYFVAIERVTSDNIKSWRNYASFERYNRFGRGDGLIGFKDVISSDVWKKYDLWVAYISSDIPCPFSCSYNPRDKKESEEYYKTPQPIDMFVTVTMGPCFSTHAGISASERAAAGYRPRGISMYLHSFAARIALALNPEMLYMVTAPTKHMIKILSAALPGHFFIGTKYQHKILQLSVENLPDEKEQTLEEKLRIIEKTPILRDLITYSGKGRLKYNNCMHLYINAISPNVPRKENLKHINKTPPVLEWAAEGNPSYRPPRWFSDKKLILYHKNSDRIAATIDGTSINAWFLDPTSNYHIYLDLFAVDINALTELHSMRPFPS